MCDNSCTPFCEMNYIGSDIVTLLYAADEIEPIWLGRVIKWIPAMIGYAFSVVCTIATLAADVALTVLFGLLSLFSSENSEMLDICKRSVYYDFQCLSVGMVGVIAPEAALQLRVYYFIINAANALSNCCANFAEELQRQIGQ